MAKTAAVIIIGNEILSGKVRDENSPFLAEELRSLGVELRLIEVIPDEVSVIAESVARCSKAYDLVFTSGGVGPTHDDVTMKGVADGLGVETVVNEEMAELLEDACGLKDDEAVLKMAEVPEGAELIKVKDMRFPPVRAKNVYVFPGIPEYLIAKFEAIKERFRDRPFLLKRVFINEEEFCVAHLIDRVDEAYPDVMIGSYPRINEKDHKVVVTLEATGQEVLDEAMQLLIDFLPAESVLKTE